MSEDDARLMAICAWIIIGAMWTALIVAAVMTR